MGERANFITVPMAITAIEQLLEWSLPVIEKTIAELSKQIIEAVAPFGYSAAPLEDRGTHLFGLRRQGGLPHDLGTRLAAKNVFVSIRGDAIRVSPNVYNTYADIERFASALKQ